MRRAHQWIFAGWFLAVIFTVPLSQSVLDLTSGRRPQFLDVFARAPTERNLRFFERQLEDSSNWAQAARPYVQYVWFRLLGEAGEKVILGRQGWLFYQPDLRYLVEPCCADDPVVAIAGFRRQLARRGIRLLVLPVPGKPAVYPEKLTRRTDGGGSIRSHTLDFIQRLRESGIEVVDLFGVFERLRAQDGTRPAYLLRDTHWSPQAARIAARAVADRIRELGWVEAGGVQYSPRQRLVERRSDIARMIPVANIEGAYPPEQVLCEQVFRADTGELYRDNPGSAVLVMGDSFLRMYQTDEPRGAGFIAHLARELRQPMASIVNDGGASTLVRQELSRRPGLLVGKRLVIWEFVERDIRYGTEGWKSVPLPDPPTPEPSRNP